jgi:hypothetical protein
MKWLAVALSFFLLLTSAHAQTFSVRHITEEFGIRVSWSKQPPDFCELFQILS